MHFAVLAAARAVAGRPCQDEIGIGLLAEQNHCCGLLSTRKQTLSVCCKCIRHLEQETQAQVTGRIEGQSSNDRRSGQPLLDAPQRSFPGLGVGT